MLHHGPRDFGYEMSLWTLDLAAQATFRHRLTDHEGSGETIRVTLVRLGNSAAAGQGVDYEPGSGESLTKRRRLKPIEPRGRHTRRREVEPSRLLAARELAERVCAAVKSPHHPHVPSPEMSA